MYVRDLLPASIYNHLTSDSFQNSIWLAVAEKIQQLPKGMTAYSSQNNHLNTLVTYMGIDVNIPKLIFYAFTEIVFSFMTQDEFALLPHLS